MSEEIPGIKDLMQFVSNEIERRDALKASIDAEVAKYVERILATVDAMAFGIGRFKPVPKTYVVVFNDQLTDVVGYFQEGFDKYGPIQTSVGLVSVEVQSSKYAPTGQCWIFPKDLTEMPGYPDGKLNGDV